MILWKSLLTDARVPVPIRPRENHPLNHRTGPTGKPFKERRSPLLFRGVGWGCRSRRRRSCLGGTTLAEAPHSWPACCACLLLSLLELADRRLLLGLGERLVVAPHHEANGLKPRSDGAVSAQPPSQSGASYQEDEDHDSKRHLPKQSPRSFPEATGNRPQLVILHSTMKLLRGSAAIPVRVPPKLRCQNG